MPIAVGIDLGTTRTAVGVYLNGEIKIIPSQTGKPFIPSCVAFTKTGCLIGDHAEEQAIDNPTNTIYDVKRIIGRKFDDSFLQEDRKRLPYKIENHEGQPKICVTYRGTERFYDPEEISAMVMKKVVQNAEVILGHQITGAVITVPAYFNDSQKQATRNAGTIAGLEVLHILNEPTAAAIAYGLNKTLKEEKNILIYDLGSGKFDTSIMNLKQGNIFEVKSTVGDTHLGGMDFDLKIVDYVADCFYKEHGKDIRDNKYATRRLKMACEQAKMYLANSEEVVVEVDCVIDNIDLNIAVTKSKFEDLCEPLIKRTMDLLAQALDESGVDKKDIHDIILVGGSSRIPKIRSLISEFFDGKFICSSVNAYAAVTYGAAIKAAILSGYKDKKIKDLLFADVTPHSIGIETSGGAMTVVIEKNTSIPCKTIYTFTTNEDSQSGITLLVFEGEMALTKDNHLLGKLELFGFPPLPRGVPQIEVTFQIDSNDILTVSTEENVYIKTRSVSIRLDKGLLSSDPTALMLKETQEFQNDDENLRNRIQYKNGLENYIYSVRKATHLVLPDKISDRDILEIHKICNEIEDWLQRNPKADKDALIEKRKLAIKLLYPYASVLDQILKVKIKGSIPVSGTNNSDANKRINCESGKELKVLKSRY